MAYICPMKCEGDKSYPEPGNCPKCGMFLKETEQISSKSSEIKITDVYGKRDEKFSFLDKNLDYNDSCLTTYFYLC